MPALTLRHLCLTGPEKESACVSFGPGLNVIYGASETGKSFIVEALDFMLGSSVELRDIPERVGYDRVFLGIEDGDGNKSTLERSSSGGQFRCYEGLHVAVPEGLEPTILSAKHNPTKSDNISTFLLEKIGLTDKRIRRNARGDTNSLSFRNLAHLCLITEGDIQKIDSPLLTGQYITRTPELAVFKLLLTGVDDRAVQPVERGPTGGPTESSSGAAKAEVIDEFLADHRDRLSGLVGEEDDNQELNEQLRKLDESLARERITLRESEQMHRAVLQHRNELRRKLEDAQNRRSEIDELLVRFKLLDKHYNSDLARLEGLREAGTLMGALSPQVCPQCGAPPEAQNHQGDCDGNIDAVISATNAESTKIKLLRQELQQAVKQLRGEAQRFDELMPEVAEQLKVEQAELEKMSPSILSHQEAYSEIFEKRATVQSALNLMASITELEDRKAAIESTPARHEETETLSADLSASVLDAFSNKLEEVLRDWHFPDASRVYFEKESHDFVIAGKPRGSRGKGMRAITHAAFTISLLEYTLTNKLLHPGFAVLDTPLLAYREPEGEEDDLSGTDVQDRFYEYLRVRDERQVIVFENIDPPESIKNLPQTRFFSKNPHIGRYGFFPV